MSAPIKNGGIVIQIGMGLYQPQENKNQYENAAVGLAASYL